MSASGSTPRSPPHSQSSLRGPWPLRVQLLGLVLVVVIPFVGVLAYVGLGDVREDARRAQMAALDLARVSAAETGEALEDAATVAMTIAARAARSGTGACGVLDLPEVVALEPEFANAFVTDPTGRPTCSAVPVPGGGVASGADRRWFTDAIAGDTVVFDGPIRGRISDRWVFVAARAVRAPNGRLLGVAGVSADMERFNTALASFPLGPDRVILVVTDEGRIVTRSLDAGSFSGSLLTDRGFGVPDGALGQRETVFEGTDLDGVARLWGGAVVPRTGWRILAGVDRTAALAPTRLTMGRGLVFSALLTMSVLILAYGVALRIQRPIAALVNAVSAVERGDFHAIAVPEGPAEFRGLAARFNTMVEARAAAEASLRASEITFQRAFGASPVPMAISTFPAGAVTDVNDAYVETFGWSRDEIVGRNALDLGLWRDPKDRETVKADLAAHRAVRNREYEFLKKNGEVVIALFSADRVELEGRPCVVSLLVDITDRRGLEGQLRQAQKMEAIGQLTGGIAHDFNNLLTAVLGNAELLAAELPPAAEPLREEADAIKAAALRGATMVRKLLAFARQERLTLAPVDLAEVCRDSASMLRRLIPETIEIGFTPAAEATWVLADRGAVDQVLLNLAANARDAMPEGGTLRIETGTAVLDDGFRRMHGFGDPGVYGTLVVSDNGLGMSEAVRQRVFEPFFTTKPRGQGTGLGMATVYGLVKQHEGYVRVVSAPGRGTATTVYFPAAAVGTHRPGAAAVTSELPGGAETVLLVEDEPLIRDVSRRLLERHGYRVLGASDGDEALTLLQAGGETVDLVVTDVVMPHRTGPELLRAAQSLDHRPRFLFTSGYADLSPTDLDVIRAADFLPKPWTAEELLVKIRTVLDRQDAAS